MTSRTHRLPAAALLLSLVLGLVFAGCGLSSYGLPGDKPTGQACTTAAQCDDRNPCTTDACGADGTCSNAAAPDGDLADPTAGDCMKSSCQAGGRVDLADPTDRPADTACSKGSCNGGTPAQAPDKDGTACAMGAAEGLCAGGACVVACGMAGSPACNDKNPCTKDSCDLQNGKCVFQPLNGVDTPGVAQTPGDCRRHVCSAGKDVNSVDDTDQPPPPASDCEVPGCNSGTPQLTPRVLGTACHTGMGKLCDDKGRCVACNVPLDCGADTECQAHTCAGNVCGVVNAPMTKLLANQTPGDCQDAVCDGNGGTTKVADNNDLPVTGNDCTTGVCNAGVPGAVNDVKNTKCGAMMALFCDGNGACLGCNDPSNCAPGNFCKAPTCVGAACGFAPQNQGMALPAAQQVAHDCQRLQCDNAGAIVSVEDDTDTPASSNNACISDTCVMGVPTHTTLVDQACAGGVCSMAAVCVACLHDAECPTPPQACLAQKCNANNTCGTTPRAAGFTVAMQVTGDCKVNQCDGNGAIVANPQPSDLPPNTACTTGTCTGALGNVPSSMNDALGTMCGDPTKECDGNGSCLLITGQACTQGSQCALGTCSDGFCCSSACASACKSCGVPGSQGTCVNVAKFGTVNAGGKTCNGVSSCDGAGNCEKNDGQGCAANGNCASGFCAPEGICCDQACNGTCKQCATGACGFVAIDQADNAPAGTCAGTSSCDGAGACKKNKGVACGSSPECTDGHCSPDGICCDTDCNQTCMQCGGGTCGVVAFGQPDTAPAGACIAANNVECDGTGVCKKLNGQACAQGTDCLNGHCSPDGICCDKACNSPCQQCGSGTCGTVAADQPDNFPANACVGTSACDGAGNCVAADGQACLTNGDCGSAQCVPGGPGSVCCHTACSGACKSCKLPTAGTCVNTTQNQTDLVCMGTNACDGAGNCKFAMGQACTMNTQCASGNCNVTCQ